MLNVNNKVTRTTPAVVLVTLLLTLDIFHTLFQCFFCQYRNFVVHFLQTFTEMLWTFWFTRNKNDSFRYARENVAGCLARYNATEAFFVKYKRIYNISHTQKNTFRLARFSKKFVTIIKKVENFMNRRKRLHCKVYMTEDIT